MKNCLHRQGKYTPQYKQDIIINFCSKFKYLPYPVNEDLLCKFSSYLADEGLAASSLDKGLSVGREVQSDERGVRRCAMSKLRQVQHGIKLVDAQSVLKRRDCPSRSRQRS